MIRTVPAQRNLVNLSAVGKAYAGRPILEDVSLGVAAASRTGRTPVRAHATANHPASVTRWSAAPGTRRGSSP